MKKKKVADWSKIIAKQSVAWEDGPKGWAVLLVPRFRKGPLAKWLQPKLRKPFIKISLDEIGDFVWRKIDGKKHFSEIAGLMKSELGQKAEPVDERLQKFLTILSQNRFAELLAPAE